MSGSAAAHVEAVGAVRGEKRTRPDDGTEFCGVRRRRSGKYGAQIWDRLRGANVWLGTFGTAEEAARAFDAAAVQLRGAAKIPAGASMTEVKEEEESGQEEGMIAEERRKKNAMPAAQTKFDSVHKYYYTRRKDSRAGRNEGRTCAVARAVAVPGMEGPSAVRALPEQPSVGATAGMATPNLRFSTSNTEDSDAESTDDMGERGKRKRTSEAAGDGSEKMMRFFEGLMKQAMERQEAMQQRFLEAMEKREQDRMIREEAWRRQDMARLAREQEILAQDRALAATRHAEVLSVIQKITAGQTAPEAAGQTAPEAAPPPSTQPPASAQMQPSPRPQKLLTMPPATPQPRKQLALVVHQSCPNIVMTPARTRTGGGDGAASWSRWLKTEVHALIRLRSNLGMRFRAAGRTRPLWEEISAGMRRMGYNRSSEQCKKKWDNMNAYFKRVKKSHWKRPEDSMTTCHYFHQLEALHRSKAALYANAALQDRIRMEAFTVAVPISQRAPRPAHNHGSEHGVGGEESSMDLLLDDFTELSFT